MLAKADLGGASGVVADTANGMEGRGRRSAATHSALTPRLRRRLRSWVTFSGTDALDSGGIILGSPRAPNSGPGSSPRSHPSLSAESFSHLLANCQSLRRGGRGDQRDCWAAHNIDIRRWIELHNLEPSSGPFGLAAQRWWRPDGPPYRRHLALRVLPAREDR
jgi:hypothetical protein